MKTDDVIDVLIETASLFRKKTKRIAAGLLDSYNAIYRPSKMFRKDKESEKEKIGETIVRLRKILSKAKKNITDVHSDLETGERGLASDVEDILNMIGGEEYLLEKIEDDPKCIPGAVREFYASINAIYNKALEIRNDYQLIKGKMYPK